MLQEIILGNTVIKFNEDLDMYSMTELWKQFGSDISKRPVKWFELPSTKEYIKALKARKNLGSRVNSPKIGLFKAMGRSGTYANWMIFLAYAKYLSPDFHILVNEYFTRLFAGDVTLADEIYDHASDVGKEWLQKRIEGKVARRLLTDSLQQHGVNGFGFSLCTNTIYEETLGAKTAVLKQEKHLTPKDNLRDNLTKVELSAIGLVEVSIPPSLNKHKDKGNKECNARCKVISQAIGNVLRELDVM